MEGPASSSDESDGDGRAPKPKTYVEEQDELKHAFLQVSTRG